MEYYEDDISIITENTDDIDGYTNWSSSCYPEHILPSTTTCNTTAHYVLQTAYYDLKKRFNNLVVKNQNITRELRDVKKSSLKMSFNDLNCPLSYNAQGAAAMAESTSSPEVAAQEGYICSLQRELNIFKTKALRFDTVQKSYEERIKMMEEKYKKVVEDESEKEKEIIILEQRLGELETENQKMIQKLEAYKMQKEEAKLKIAQGQGPECIQDEKLILKLKELEQECAHLHMNEEIVRSNMVEKDEEIKHLRERVGQLEAEVASSQSQLESLSLASIPANEELMHLKKVIKGLKGSVIQQNEFLTNIVKTSTFKNSTTELQGKINPSEVTAKQFDDLDSVNVGSNNRMMSPLRHVGKSFSQGCIAEDSPLLKVQLPPQTRQASERSQAIFQACQGQSSEGIQASATPQGSKSEIVRRQPPRTQPQADVSRSEVLPRITSQNGIYQINVHGQHDESWLDVNNLVSTYDNAGRPVNPITTRYEGPQRQNDTGYDVPQRKSDTKYDLSPRQNGSGSNLSQRQSGLSYDTELKQSSPDYVIPPRLISSGYYIQSRQSGSGSNLSQRKISADYVMPPGQSGLDYVMPPGQGGSDYVMPPGQGGSDYVMPPGQGGSDYVMPPGQRNSNSNLLPVRISEHGALSPKDRSSEENVNRCVTPERTNSSHVCPVCSVDFPDYTMDEFQTHVFECFDDSDAPETLHADQCAINDKICPMCNAMFPGTIPQLEFETHVQTHFEDGSATGFEILAP